MALSNPVRFVRPGRGVKAEQIQCDEIWSFCYAKAKNVAKAKAAPEGKQVSGQC